MTSGCELSPLTEDDVAWSPDPFAHPRYLRAVAHATDRTAVEVRCQGDGWSVRYPLLLEAFGGSGWLARTPDYGGPVLSGVATGSAAREARARVDSVLRAHRVISEVTLSSPFSPLAPSLAHAWGLRPSKPVCTWPIPPEQSRLSHGRRTDLRRTENAPVTFELLDGPQAAAFAASYGAAMERVDAAHRWRLDVGYFTALAQSGLVYRCAVQEAEGGADALFLVHGRHAAYLFATRWGASTGASSRVLWAAGEKLSASGVKDILLGGGVTDDDADPLLRFKRSWGGTEQVQLLGARCFDIPAQQLAEDAGSARPLPAWWTAA
ncbi:MAG: hypothetical protein M3N21_00100 [Actinomycetota bacterium]|nr:hypothetical protein [Actinomycetota bacterium]